MPCTQTCPSSADSLENIFAYSPVLRISALILYPPVGVFVVSKPLLLEGLTCLRKRGNRFARDHQAGETKTASVARSLQGSFEGLISVSRRPGCHSVAEFHSALPKKHWSFKKAFGYCKPELQMLWQSGEQRLPHGLLLATGWADVAQPARIFGGRLQAMI